MLTCFTKGGVDMQRKKYVQPTIVCFSEEDILAIEALAKCSNSSLSGRCSGKCHKGVN